MMEVSFTEEDGYGQKHPIESSELIAAKIQELNDELDKQLKGNDKHNWETAKTKCPHLVGDDFKLMFLRCEVFHADLAAIRIGKYWTKRIYLFGPDNAFLPLTQKVALKDDVETMKLGFARLLPFQDPVGRAVMLIDPSRQDKAVYKTYDSFVRYIWYMMHAALVLDESPTTAQQKGFVMLINPQNAKFSQFNPELDKHIMESLKGILPIRISSMQICYPPSFIRLILPIIKLLMGERLRKRIKIHTGKQADVLEKLKKYGFDENMVPTDLGGKYVVDHDAWLAKRAKQEL